MKKLLIEDIELEALEAQELSENEEMAISAGAECTSLVHCMSYNQAMTKHGPNGTSKYFGYCPYF